MRTGDRARGEDEPRNSGARVSVCPKCNGPVFREHRRLMDRLISLIRPVRRYRCDAHLCQWKGVLPVPKSRA